MVAPGIESLSKAQALLAAFLSSAASPKAPPPDKMVYKSRGAPKVGLGGSSISSPQCHPPPSSPTSNPKPPTNTPSKAPLPREQGRLSQEDIDRLVKEAEEFAEADKKVKERVDARNALETYCYNMKSSAEDKLKARAAGGGAGWGAGWVGWVGESRGGERSCALRSAPPNPPSHQAPSL